MAWWHIVCLKCGAKQSLWLMININDNCRPTMNDDVVRCHNVSTSEVVTQALPAFKATMSCEHLRASVSRPSFAIAMST